MMLTVAGLRAQVPPEGLTVAIPTSTNTVTNATVYLPVGTWTNAVIYDPQTSLDTATTLMWDPSPGATTNVGYRIYFGQASQKDEFQADTGTNRVAVIFGMSSQLTYFFYVTALTAELEPLESKPSNLVIIKKTR